MGRAASSAPACRLGIGVQLDDEAQSRFRYHLRAACRECGGREVTINGRLRFRSRLLATQKHQHRPVAALLGTGRGEGQHLVVAAQQLIGQQLEYRPAHG